MQTVIAPDGSTLTLIPETIGDGVVVGQISCEAKDNAAVVLNSDFSLTISLTGTPPPPPPTPAAPTSAKRPAAQPVMR